MKPTDLYESPPDKCPRCGSKLESYRGGFSCDDGEAVDPSADYECGAFALFQDGEWQFFHEEAECGALAEIANLRAKLAEAEEVVDYMAEFIKYWVLHEENEAMYLEFDGDRIEYIAEMPAMKRALEKIVKEPR